MKSILLMLMALLFTLEGRTTGMGVPNPNAPKGGTFTYNLGGEPNTLHPITSTDFYGRRIHDFIMDSLADHNLNTYEIEPHLAERWEISKDNREFTFFIRKNAQFHDGTSVTAEDVKFSFDAIFEPKYEAGHLRPFFENIEKVEILDPQTVRFYTKNTYFKNFDQVASLYIIPKHIYENVDKSKKMNREVVGAGPYKLDKFEKGEKLVLRRFESWYGFKEPQFKGLYNFDLMIAKFIRDETTALEMLKKGDLDFTEMRGDAYQLKATGSVWGKSVLKVKYENLQPKNWYFYGWNFHNPIFSSKKVRQALSYLMDREGMIKKFLFGFSKPAVAPMWYQNASAPVGLKPIPFDPEKAQKLLKEEGWEDADKNGILEKTINGVKTEFRFTMLHPNKDYEKYHTWYQEDLRKVGIVMDIKLLDWSAFEPLMRDSKFDAIAMAWGGGDQDPDPKQLWHSSSIKEGSNFIGYSNSQVDKMIDEARLESHREKRIKLMRKIYERINEDAAYTCWFNTIFEFYGVGARIQRPADTLKFKVGFHSWWINP